MGQDRAGMRSRQLPQGDVLLSEADHAALQQFLLYLGSGLTAAGEAVNEIQERVRRVAVAYGAPDAVVSVLPTFVTVSLGPGRQAEVESTQQLRGQLRLDQTAALYELLKKAERAEVPPADGVREILEIVAMRPRYGSAATILGHVVLTVGICLVLQPSLGDLVLAALFGALVAALKMIGGRWTSVQMIMPVTAAFAVSSITLALADQGWANADLRAMIPPLVTFLPGAALTMSVVELSAGEMVTGASRLVAGMLQLVLLAFGIVAGAQAFGIPSSDALGDDPVNLLGWWAPWLGVAVVAVGTYLYHSPPAGSFGWLIVVLYSAWVGQFVGGEAFGGYVGGFVGALVMTPVAYAVERRPSGPPALVSFLPAFWLLVPGALGLIGVTEYLAADPEAGIQDFIGTVGSIIAIALGVLCGYPLYRSLARSLGWIEELRPWRAEGRA
jgi:uncharacterized membrane protein YjjP (DUF1212 family)